MKTTIIFLACLLLLTGCSSKNETSNYSSERTIYEVNNITNYSSKENSSTVQELFVYKTTILTKTDERQNNVKLACSQLNNTIVASGETFSFCDTLRAC